jgi:hypothetical protein
MVSQLTALRFQGTDYPLGIFETDFACVGTSIEDEQGRTWLTRAGITPIRSASSFCVSPRSPRRRRTKTASPPSIRRSITR